MKDREMEIAFWRGYLWVAGIKSWEVWDSIRRKQDQTRWIFENA